MLKALIEAIDIVFESFYTRTASLLVLVAAWFLWLDRRRPSCFRFPRTRKVVRGVHELCSTTSVMFPPRRAQALVYDERFLRTKRANDADTIHYPPITIDIHITNTCILLLFVQTSQEVLEQEKEIR